MSNKTLKIPIFIVWYKELVVSVFAVLGLFVLNSRPVRRWTCMAGNTLFIKSIRMYSVFAGFTFEQRRTSQVTAYSVA